jgi:hypothetical protein
LQSLKNKIMPITTNYYLNGPTLSTATAVFTDATLTICAPDGYYSDTIVRRRQVGCVLQVAQTCPSCCIFSFTTTTSAQDNSNTACAQPIDNTYYYQPVDCIDDGIAAGDPVFYDSAASIPLDNGWYSIPTGNPECPISYQVVSGVVTEFLTCCPLFPYQSSVDPFRTFEGVCGQEMPITYYTNSLSLPYLTVGDLVYQDSGGTTSLLDGWYIMETDVPACPLAYEVSGGVVITTYNCCA